MQRQEVTVKYHHKTDTSFRESRMEKDEKDAKDAPLGNQLVEPTVKPEESVSIRARSPSAYNINEMTISLSPNTLDGQGHLSSKHIYVNGNHWENSRGSSVKICEDKNITFQITPRNRGYRSNNKIAKCYSNLRSKTRKLDLTNVKSRVNTGIDIQAVIAGHKNKQTAVTNELDDCDHLGLEVNAKPVGKKVDNKASSVPIVMVKYNDDENYAPCSDKPVGRRVKQEVITMVSQFNQSDSEDDRLKIRSPEQSDKSFDPTSRLTPSPMQRVRSNPEKNYYEVAMRTEQGKKPDNCESPTDNFLYKTIKTIEFDEIGQSPRESVVKSIIPGTTSVTKPRQKLAVCVDYLGRRRTSSSSLSTASMQKVNHVRLCAMAFGL